ncbi:DUF1836 domain-containing protein [Jutongia sp. SJQ-6]|jgi:DNA-binding transcriptional MerR regulator
MHEKYDRDMIDLLRSIQNIDYIEPDEIPNIDLYMDQITTFMDDHLKSSKRFEDDKILTKTMINNYSKNNLLPPSEKKKYSPEHMVLLLFIYYFKNFLSINDIQSILAPITKRFFHSENDRNLNTVYEEIFQRQYENIDFEVRDMIRKLRDSNKAFADIEDDEERKLLSNFAFICSLSFDIWVKKSVIESIIDKDMMDQKKSNSKKKN